MINFIEFENFKSWKKASLSCAPITGLFGKNSSGKSSIIQFLLMLKQTKDAADRAIPLEFDGDLVSLGSIYEATHEGANGLKWHLSMELDSEIVLRDSSKSNQDIIAQGRRIDLQSEVSFKNALPSSSKLIYSISGHNFELREMQTEDDSKKGIHSKQAFSLHYNGDGAKSSDFQFVRNEELSGRLPGPIKSYAFPEQARSHFQNSGFLADLELAYVQQMDKIHYLGPLRKPIERQFRWKGTQPTDVGTSGERTMDAILHSSIDEKENPLLVSSNDLTLRRMIEIKLSEMDLVKKFSVEEIGGDTNRWEARVKVDSDSKNVSIADVGFGVSQVLPVITLLLYVPEGSTVMLEQPELHLHPLAQAELADLIIYVAKERNVQVILESHSEHLLLRLQRRIAEEHLPASHANIYACEHTGRQSELTELQLDEFGQISNWPEKFMGDIFNETADAVIARLDRQIAAEKNTAGN